MTIIYWICDELLHKIFAQIMNLEYEDYIDVIKDEDKRKLINNLMSFLKIEFVILKFLVFFHK